jgi:ribosomal-protein-alanine N-acetyltransferase
MAGSMDDILIRRLERPAEAEACARLMAASDPWKTLRRGYAESLALMTDPDREVYLAVAEDQVVGFVVIIMQGAFVGYIQSVGVWPAWRGKGFGSRLIKFAEDRIFRETANVFICASSFNHDVQRLYERLGYEVVGKLKEYIVPGHSEILYRKTTGPLAGSEPRST